MDRFGPTRIFYSGKRYSIKVPQLNLKYHCKKLKESNEDGKYSTFINEILKGVKINYLECINNRHIEQYVAKTKFSAFGFLNIQEKIENDKIGIGPLKGIKEIINNNKEFSSLEKANIYNLLHGRSNYGIDREGNIKIINYGEKEVIKFIKLFGDKIIEVVEKSINNNNGLELIKDKKGKTKLIIDDDIKKLLGEEKMKEIRKHSKGD